MERGQSAPPSAHAGAAGPPALSLVVTYAGWSRDTDRVEVSGFAPGIVESGGTCTVSVVSPTGTPALRVSRPATPDATTTSCGQLAIDVGGLARGRWQVTLDYSSVTTESASEPLTVVVGP